MKAATKRISAILAIAVYALTIFAGVRFFGWSAKTAFADEAETNIGRTYYYEELNELSKKFYDAIDDMAKSGDLKKGNAEYDLVDKGVITEDDAKGYVGNGQSKVPVAFGCARDAYYMDHPELFYVDIYKLTLSAGTQGDGKYVCYIDAGRAENYYLKDSGLDSVEKIDAEIASFNTKVNAIATEAAKIEDKAGQVKYVNKAICETVTYDFGEDGNGNKTDAFAHVQTAYGALVKGKAVCGGYGMAFKAVMDKLEIPCVCIQGVARPVGNDGYEAHMWNAVKLDGMWYGVDTTWNDTDKPEKTYTENYMLIGSGFLNKTHIEDGVISTSGFELKYPALKPYAYGVDEDSNGMKITGKYSQLPGEESTTLYVTVSYDGKGAVELEKEGKYLAYRFYSRDDDTGEIVPTGWVGASALINSGYFEEGVDIDTPTSHSVYINNLTYGIQFVVASVPPYGEEVDLPVFAYGYDIKPEHMLTGLSTIYENDKFENYKPAPLPKKITPDALINLDTQTYQDITITYSDKLEFLEGETVPKLKVSSTYGDMLAQDYVKIENVRFNAETNELSFRFYPSTQYSHDCLVYKITTENLVGSYSKKIPAEASIVVRRNFYICNKMLPGGRLYIKAYGEPVMVANEDMSMKGFVDKNGKHLSENQRSQLMLVVNKTSDEKNTQMKDMLKNETGVMTNNAATYEIDLHVCGCLGTVPNGSYMQVGFGFPEGYGPDDEGTTFKVYHYTHDDDGNITGYKEVPCVVTKDGIVATVDSFSPFAVVAVDKSAVTTKNIYAQAVTDGGKVTCSSGNGVATLNDGDSITYTIEPENGYELESVLLNGKDVTSKVNDGTLTLNASELGASSKVEVSFVSQAAAQQYKSKGITVVRPVITVTASDIPEAIAHAEGVNPEAPAGTADLTVALIVIAVVIVVAAGAVAVALFLVLRNKKASGKN